MKSEFRLEIAHVLFIDIVGYSKLSINEQHARIEELTEIVCASDQFQQAEAAGRLLKIPAGDGMALVFYTSPEDPARSALEITRILKGHPRLQLRMGIHSGPVSGVRDVTGRANLAGAGINMAQRVMDCGDAGHILLSKHVAEDLEEYEQWRPLLHDLGTCEVKHGVRVSIVNLYAKDAGNPKLPRKFEDLHKRRKRLRWTTVGTGLLAVAALLVAGVFLSRKRQSTLSAVPEKSVAVLPFENLSHDPENTYFADGVQEEILTRLARIADLKVISRTSTQRYKSSPQNLRKIAQELGVANILEGSVQRVADQVRVNVQLIKAASDAHLWADTYDRHFTDIFAIESEIARTIADTLQARLTGSEEKAIATRPTQNTQAHQLYLKGQYFWNKRTGPDLYKALDYFNEAVREDPSFALSYAGVASTYALLPMYADAAPKDCWPKAESAAKKALELDETIAEAHTALGAVLAFERDFAGASQELRRAIQLNPNYATAHHWLARGVSLPTGRFDDAIAEIKRALDLDPLSLVINASLGIIYTYARRYDEAISQLQRTLELDPNFFPTLLSLGNALELKGDHQAAIDEYEKARQLSGDPSIVACLAYSFARAGQRNEALKLLAQSNEISGDSSTRPSLPAFDFAIAYLGLGDTERALQLLEKSYENREYEINDIRVDPFLDSLRGNPRFEKLANRVIAPEKNTQR